MDDKLREVLKVAISNYYDTRSKDISSFRSIFTQATLVVHNRFIENHQREILELKSQSSQQAFSQAVLFIAMTAGSEILVAAFVAHFLSSIIRISNISRSIIITGNTAILRNISVLKITAKPGDVLKKTAIFQLQTKVFEELINRKLDSLSSSKTPIVQARRQNKVNKTMYENLSNSINGYLDIQGSIILSNKKYLSNLTLHDSEPHLSNEETKNLITILEENSVELLTKESQGEYGEHSFLFDFMVTTIYLSMINLYTSVQKNDMASLNEVLQEPPMGYNISKKVKSLYNNIATDSATGRAALLGRYRLTILDEKHWSFLRARTIDILGLNNDVVEKNAYTNIPMSEFLHPSEEYKIMSAHVSSKKDIIVFNFLSQIEDALNRSEFSLFE